MKKKLLKLLFLASAMVLCACSSPFLPLENPLHVEREPIPSSENSDSPLKPLENIPIVDDTTPPKEGMVRSRLTNEWVDEEVAATRPIAVMIPNEAAAIPQYNISKASVLYEANVEGEMTRMMGIFEDWQDLERIGNIRSLRAYYAYWAFEWDSIIVHFGGPYFINSLLEESTTQNINGTLGEIPAFFRSTDRPKPHNAYASGKGLTRAISNKGYSLNYRGLTADNHFQFVPKATPNTLDQYGENTKNATYIDMTGCFPLTRCYFEYNEEDGLYYRSQHLSGALDGPHMDAATDEQLTFKNIIVQYTKHEEIGEGYLAFQCHDTTRTGWYFTNGRGIPVSWEKTGDYEATRYFDPDGNEVSFNTGKTMILIVEDGDTFNFR